ncbi:MULTISPECIES: hypothetical protein [unclassified Caballeronia]|uniref:hypothetical protein n=1 Tax=unclassified Caballeronia TaxID=2646786 RepID=UPI0028669575|nr:MULTISPECIES: hypothetical protein [unclassified Caballeronia]MDR5813456.1 hypothetical protein [Caballeronia sp. LZ033]MDR5820213.1 hypothetical protein [Caballeronia sp. LZ043]MDR5878029.1 hypothetical protein [Caballeronia sp. LZ032]
MVTFAPRPTRSFAYFLNSWLPVMVRGNHFSMSDAAVVAAMMQVGGTLGNIVIGWEMDRLEAHTVMMVTLVAAGIFAVVLAKMTFELSGLMTMVPALHVPDATHRRCNPCRSCGRPARRYAHADGGGAPGRGKVMDAACLWFGCWLALQGVVR